MSLLTVGLRGLSKELELQKTEASVFFRVKFWCILMGLLAVATPTSLRAAQIAKDDLINLDHVQETEKVYVHKILTSHIADHPKMAADYLCASQYIDRIQLFRIEAMHANELAYSSSLMKDIRDELFLLQSAERSAKTAQILLDRMISYKAGPGICPDDVMEAQFRLLSVQFGTEVNKDVVMLLLHLMKAETTVEVLISAEKDRREAQKSSAE